MKRRPEIGDWRDIYRDPVAAGVAAVLVLVIGAILAAEWWVASGNSFSDLVGIKISITVDSREAPRSLEDAGQ